MTFGYAIIDVDEDEEKYADVPWQLGCDDELIIYLLFTFFDVKNEQERPACLAALKESPPATEVLMRRLFVFTEADYLPPSPAEDDPQYWHPPEALAEAADAMAEVFRHGKPLAHYLWQQTQLDWPDNVEKLTDEGYNKLDGKHTTPHSQPGDWDAYFAQQFERLATAFRAIGAKGEKLVRFDWHP